MRIAALLFLCIASCSKRPLDAESALAEGRRIDARQGYDRVNTEARRIVDRLVSLVELETLVRRCEEELRKGPPGRPALFDLKNAAVLRLADVGGRGAAESLVRLYRQDLNWDGEAGHVMCCAIVACGPAALPVLERWRAESKDPDASDLTEMIRSGRLP